MGDVRAAARARTRRMRRLGVGEFMGRNGRVRAFAGPWPLCAEPWILYAARWDGAGEGMTLERIVKFALDNWTAGGNS